MPRFRILVYGDHAWPIAVIAYAPSLVDAIDRAGREMDTGKYSRVTVELGTEEVYVA